MPLLGASHFLRFNIFLSSFVAQYTPSLSELIYYLLPPLCYYYNFSPHIYFMLGNGVAARDASKEILHHHFYLVLLLL